MRDCVVVVVFSRKIYYRIAASLLRHPAMHFPHRDLLLYLKDPQQAPAVGKRGICLDRIRSQAAIKDWVLSLTILGGRKPCRAIGEGAKKLKRPHLARVK